MLYGRTLVHILRVTVVLKKVYKYMETRELKRTQICRTANLNGRELKGVYGTHQGRDWRLVK